MHVRNLLQATTVRVHGVLFQAPPETRRKQYVTSSTVNTRRARLAPAERNLCFVAAVSMHYEYVPYTSPRADMNEDNSPTVLTDGGIKVNAGSACQPPCSRSI